MKMTRIQPIVVLILLLTVPFAQAQHQGHPSTYQTETDQSIKALSAQDISGYLNGRGMGLAKAAELNGYPGPMHVLEAEKELRLTADQKVKIQRTYDTMHRQAVALGQQIVTRETALNQLFASQQATPQAVQTTLDSLGRLQGQLRLAHLAAHLKTKQILSGEQVQQYNQLRGYTK